MRVLITGGAGFLGFHTANHLAERGSESVVYDVASLVPADFPAGTTGIVGDVRDAQSLTRAFREHRPDAVVHAAAALPLYVRHHVALTTAERAAGAVLS